MDASKAQVDRVKSAMMRLLVGSFRGRFVVVCRGWRRVRQLPRPGEDRVEHRLGELARERVLLADVVRAEDGQGAVTARPGMGLHAVAERRSRAHPELTARRAGDLVVTYATNSFEFADLFTPQGASTLYWPRVVVIPAERSD